MVGHFQSLNNVGQFDTIAPGVQLSFAPLSILYAENGRGKTTMAAIFRSLSSGDPKLITDRHRVGAANVPHIMLQSLDGAQHTFQNGAWNASISDLVVFDEE